MTKPHALQPGDTIAIVSPSAGIASLVPRRFRRGLDYLEGMGYTVKVMPHALGRRGHRAGTYEEQAEDLNQAFADPGVNMILTTIGGYTSNGVLRYLDWGLVRRHPKIVMGYSDTTSLLTGLHTAGGLVTFYGPALLPTFAEFPEMLPYSRDSFLDAVTGRTPVWRPSPAWTQEKTSWDETDDRPRGLTPNAGWQVLRPGKACGPVLAGNLTILMSLAETPYFPDFTGRLLCIEDDCTCPLPYWDNHFNHLRDLGVFDRVAGLLIGRTQDMPRETAPGGYGWRELLEEQLGTLDVPVAWDVDFGHTDPMLTLPLGVEAEMDTDHQTLTLLEPAVLL